jgi:hypothetical protein
MCNTLRSKGKTTASIVTVNTDDIPYRNIISCLKAGYLFLKPALTVYNFPLTR